MIVTILPPEELLSQCMMNQKNVIYGDVRSYSCWECDMHVSDESWLYKHLAGEKHRWVKKRVDQRLDTNNLTQDSGYSYRLET